MGSTYTCLVINTGRHQVLVDPGEGGMVPTTGKLIPNLQAEGIAPDKTDVRQLCRYRPTQMESRSVILAEIEVDAPYHLTSALQLTLFAQTSLRWIRKARRRYMKLPHGE